MEHPEERTPLDRLVEKTGCTREQASRALTQGSGSLLDGLLFLENEGLYPPPPNAGFYSTQHRQEPPNYGLLPSPEEVDNPWTWGRFLKHLFHELVFNRLEVWYQGAELFSLPILVPIALTLLTYVSLLPVMFVSLLFGVGYQFSMKDSFLGQYNLDIQRFGQKCHHYVRQSGRRKE